MKCSEHARSECMSSPLDWNVYCPANIKKISPTLAKRWPTRDDGAEPRVLAVRSYTIKAAVSRTNRSLKGYPVRWMQIRLGSCWRKYETIYWYALQNILPWAEFRSQYIQKGGFKTIPRTIFSKSAKNEEFAIWLCKAHSSSRSWEWRNRNISRSHDGWQVSPHACW